MIKMLSQIELEFLKSPERFDANYRRVLRHRIKAKVQRLKVILPLLDRSGFSVTESYNSVTNFRNGQISSNQAAFKEWVVARERFELSSAGPKPAMLVHYTTGLRTQGVF